jgi:hypothetical protein
MMKKIKTIEDFNLSNKNGRHKARKNGFDVPKQKTGRKIPEFWSLIQKKSDKECWFWLGK